MPDPVSMRFARAAQRDGASLCSICSANPFVVDATLEIAADAGDFALIEATSNQVNQYGGYTGMRPGDFLAFVRDRATDIGLPFDRVILGGDHLGPYPWRSERAAVAMDRARAMVAEYVEAGFRKIHLDASMPLGGDSPAGNGGAGDAGLAPALAAQRSADLCIAAESACARDQPPPLYVIGTEVPVPGGTRGADEAPAPTRVVDMESTLDLTRRAFLARGLEAAWRRVIALVVQPGVEFGDHRVHPYERAKALPLSKALARHPGLVFEGHSTDYQHPSRLREMAADGIAIQKVGPALTFAFREAVFLLSRIEEELVAITAGGRPAHVPEVLERTMLAKPAHWAGYYRGSGTALSLELRYSFSDRCRYYWSEPELRVALPALLDNLGAADIPDALLSQYLPNQYWRIRDGSLSRLPAELIKDRIKDVLRSYPQYAPAIRDHAAAA